MPHTILHQEKSISAKTLGTGSLWSQIVGIALEEVFEGTRSTEIDNDYEITYCYQGRHVLKAGVSNVGTPANDVKASLNFIIFAKIRTAETLSKVYIQCNTRSLMYIIARL